MPDPVSGKFHLININAGDRFRSGDIISAKVTAVLPNGRFRLFFNGRMLTAKSPLSFNSGQIIRAKVEQNNKGTFLHLLNSHSSSSQKNLSSESIKTLLSASLLRAGISLSGEAETLRRTSLLNRTKGSQLRISRLYAELLAKGADPSAAFLESVDSMFSAGNGGHGSRNWQSPPQPEELTKELSEDSPEHIDEDDSVLNLLNSVPGKKDGWMFKRLFRKLGDGELRMVWKIRRGMDPALALTVYDGSRTFEFLMEGLEKTHMAVYTGDKTEIDEKYWKTFRENLALMNIDVDDTLLPIDKSDGFTSGSDQVLQDLEGWI